MNDDYKVTELAKVAFVDIDNYQEASGLWLDEPLLNANFFQSQLVVAPQCTATSGRAGMPPLSPHLTETIPRTFFSRPPFRSNSGPAKHFREMSTSNRGIVKEHFAARARPSPMVAT